jgi:methionyl-tRNA formyltransferase
MFMAIRKRTNGKYLPGDTIILLTGKEEFLYLDNLFHTISSELIIEHATNISSLEKIIRKSQTSRKRLVAFCYGAIVPEKMLDALPGLSYNFHPGSPTYPGNHVAGFALYEGAKHFGATAHIMTPRVDEGAIIGTEIFDVPKYCEFVMLEIMTYQAMLRLFGFLAPKLADLDNEIEPIEVKWAERKYTSKDLKAMFSAWAVLKEAEQLRRIHAFGALSKDNLPN